MHQASVGFHCPECVAREHTRVVRGRGLGPGQPVLTLVLMGLNIAVWLVGQIIWRTEDLLTTAPEAISKGGLYANLPSKVAYVGGRVVGYADYVGVAHGEWYRLLTSGFIHAGIIHLAVNMWVLYILGRIFEEQLGRLRLGLVYFASLFAGSLGALIASPDSITVGASGAIFGLMGGLLAIAKARGVALRNTGLVGLVVINLVITFTLSSYISVGGHVGGLVGGAIAGFVIVDLPDRMPRADRRTRTLIAWAGGIGLSLLFIAASIVAADVAADRGNRYTGAAAPAHAPVSGATRSSVSQQFGGGLGRHDVDQHPGALLEAHDAGHPGHDVDVPVVPGVVVVGQGVDHHVVGQITGPVA